MGLLEQVIGGVLGSRMGGGSPMGRQFGRQGGMSPLMVALMSLLASRTTGQGGGLGGLLGGLTGGDADRADSPGGNMGASGRGGGLGGLLDSFQRSGHGDVMQSWMGTAENREISPNQLGDALGKRTVDDLSRQTGMPHDDLLSELSRVLPGVVDQMTPHGRMPEPHEVEKW